VKQGTISVLFGCHSPVHSVIVIVAWRKLYGKLPNYWETSCILLHDIGHWGTNYLDNIEEKKQHGVLGSRVAGKLFGQKGYDLCAGHNPYIGIPRSKLYEPDKYSWCIAPLSWIWLTTFFEPKLIWKGCTRWQSAVNFRQSMRKNQETGFKELAHDIYLKRCKEEQVGDKK